MTIELQIGTIINTIYNTYPQSIIDIVFNKINKTITIRLIISSHKENIEKLWITLSKNLNHSYKFIVI